MSRLDTIEALSVWMLEQGELDYPLEVWMRVVADYPLPWEFLGKGGSAVVFKTLSGRALRISDVFGEEGVLSYYGVVQGSGDKNPLCPVIFAIKYYDDAESEVGMSLSVVEMERLYEVDEDVCYTGEFKHKSWELIPYLRDAYSAVTAEMFLVGDLMLGVSESGLLMYQSFVSLLSSVQSRDWDMHMKNLMHRENGELVVIDAVY